MAAPSRLDGRDPDTQTRNSNEDADSTKERQRWSLRVSNNPTSEDTRGRNGHAPVIRYTPAGSRVGGVLVKPGELRARAILVGVCLVAMGVIGAAAGCEKTVVDLVCPTLCARMGGQRLDVSQVPAGSCACVFHVPPLVISGADGGRP
jgi:hypothetical protein